MTDSNEPTAWEEINPPATVSAPRRELQSRCSGQTDRKVFRNELTACLTLVAPVGMTEEAKRDWLAVAWNTLQHIPADILASGAAKARMLCDHPSKIVPTIVAETAEQMRWRREAREESCLQLPAPPPDYCTPEEAAEILRSVGLKSHFPSHRSGAGAQVDRSPEGGDPEDGRHSRERGREAMRP